MIHHLLAKTVAVGVLGAAGYKFYKSRKAAPSPTPPAPSPQPGPPPPTPAPAAIPASAQADPSTMSQAQAQAAVNAIEAAGQLPSSDLGQAAGAPDETSAADTSDSSTDTSSGDDSTLASIAGAVDVLGI